MQTDTWSCKSITDFAARLQYGAVKLPCPVDYLFLYVLRLPIVPFHFYLDSLFSGRATAPGIPIVLCPADPCTEHSLVP